MDMNKNKRLISFIGVEKSVIGIIASYCHFLKPKLNDHWVVHRFDEKSEVVIVSQNEANFQNNDLQIKIVLGGADRVSRGKDEGLVKVYNLPIPIHSSQILKVLNASSEHKFKKQTSGSKYSFSLKNIFSRFLHKSTPVEKTNKNKSLKMANKLLNLKKSQLNTLKVVFLGRPGSGKTTAVSSAGSDNMLTSEVNATDSVGLLKKQTTIGIDYNECTFNNEIKLRLYGTPGQKRYDYVQNQTVTRADIYVILVDLSSVAPFAEFLYYKDIIDSSGNDKALRVVAFTHYDISEHNMMQLSKEIRHKCHGEVLTVKIDTRKKDEVKFMLEKSARLRLGSVPQNQFYAENSLFLKNINAKK